jgi:hypothetical protein
MAFPSTADPLSRALLDVQTEARSLKQYVTDVRAQCAAGPVSANLIVELYLRLVQANTRFTAAAAVTGLGQYAKDQFSNQALDVVAEFTAMSTAVVACGTWIINNMPKDAGGYLLKDQLTPAGVSVRSFTSAETAGLRTQLDALLATVN